MIEGCGSNVPFSWAFCLVLKFSVFGLALKFRVFGLTLIFRGFCVILMGGTIFNS